MHLLRFSRSDVFLADTYLRSLERDYCEDLLIDTSDALNWLDSTNESVDTVIKKRLKTFSFDFKALYDSIDPELAIDALKSAITECRPDWSVEFCEWIISLVRLSFKASIGQFEGTWYRQKKGVPTGGSLCVQIANITVFFVLRKEVYSDVTLMKPVKSIKRFIDDGSGAFDGTSRQYSEFINTVNTRISPYGLYIDEFSIESNGNYIPFLDIQFCFDSCGELQTDLYTKETDSRAYLFYGSCHPNHVYSSIVYSQCLRLRRIINDDTRLSKRIDELKLCFKNSNYPKKMVEKITTKVKSLPRLLPAPRDSSSSSILLPKSPVKSEIRVISTYGSDSSLVDIVDKYKDVLGSTKSFSSGSTNSLCSDTQSTGSSNAKKGKGDLFKKIKRTGSSLRNKLVKPRQFATDSSITTTIPCGNINCKCCEMVTKKNELLINGVKVKPAAGTCSSYNIIYGFVCKQCSKCYVGRTTRPLKKRVTDHRGMFYELLRDPSVRFKENFDISDVYSLGVHLIDNHGIMDRDKFDENYEVLILCNSSPNSLEINEHKMIQKLKTVKPLGINSVDPLGIPLLSVLKNPLTN